MSEAVALRPGKPIALSPTNLAEAMEFADRMAKSSLVPKDFQGNPGNILVAVQWGAEIGLQPLQAMQSIAVINGRPSVWGDALLAMVRGSPACEYVREHIDGDGEAMVAVCQVKRRGDVEQVRAWSVADAKKAGLWNKQGPWSQYPKRMLQMRARAFALRDVFPDVLRGMAVAEEAADLPRERDITPAAETPRHGNAGLMAALAVTAPAPAEQIDTSTGEVLPAVTLAQVTAAIAAAQSEDDLNAAADLARQLDSDDDKAAARKAYAARMHELES